jgi:hypothetical protein
MVGGLGDGSHGLHDRSHLVAFDPARTEGVETLLTSKQTKPAKALGLLELPFILHPA